jgi:hypothetical protein
VAGPFADILTAATSQSPRHHELQSSGIAEPCAAANRLRGHGTCGRPPPPCHPPAGAAPAPPVAELGVVRPLATRTLYGIPTKLTRKPPH